MKGSKEMQMEERELELLSDSRKQNEIIREYLNTRNYGNKIIKSKNKTVQSDKRL